MFGANFNKFGVTDDDLNDIMGKKHGRGYGMVYEESFCGQGNGAFNGYKDIEESTDILASLPNSWIRE